MAAMPREECARRLGDLALEANGCFMVQVPTRPNRIQGCGAIRTRKASSPRNTGNIDPGIDMPAHQLPIVPSDNERRAYGKLLNSEIPIQGFPPLL